MKILLFANSDWYLFNFRLSLARALMNEGHEVVLASPAGSYGNLLQDLGFNWVSVPMNRRSLNPYREIKLLLWLRRLFLAEKYDLVHGFTIKCAIYGSIIARTLPRHAHRPLRVSAVAGMGYVFASRRRMAALLKPFVRILFRLAFGGENIRLILQNADDVKYFQREHLINPKFIELIQGSGVDCHKFLPVGESTYKVGAPFRVVLPARLLWDKGIAEYVDAARMLLSEGREIEFYLAGAPDAGNPASVSSRHIKMWHQEGVVRALGHIDDMSVLYQSMHLVVLPSYREGLSRSLLEAGACALPVVTTNVPGCNDVVTDNVDGLLVPPYSARALAAAIAFMHDNASRRREFGLALRRKIAERFDERRINQLTIAVYEELSQHAR